MCLATYDGAGHDTIVGGAGSDNWLRRTTWTHVSSVEDKFPCFDE